MSHSVSSSATERVVAALDAALPFVPRDLHRLTAEYARAIGADFDLDTCLVAVPAREGQKHSYHKPDKPQPSTASLCSPLVEPATIVTMEVADIASDDANGFAQKFVRIVGRQTFRQSGLRRFAIRMGDGCGWTLGIGVTAHTPEEATATTPQGGMVQSASDAKTALQTICDPQACMNGRVIPTDKAADLPQPTPPQGCLPLQPLRSYMSGDHTVMVITVEIDSKSNSFAVQYHTPDRASASIYNKAGALRTRNPKPLAPSELQRFPFPSDIDILDCRPCLARWGRTTVSEVEAADAFPLWARAPSQCAREEGGREGLRAECMRD
jgi:hypothetical protein